MLSWWLKIEVIRARRAASSLSPRARSQSLASPFERRIWAAFAPGPKLARLVPWCGVPSVTMRATRALPCARIQARATRPPMLWATMATCGAPVAAHSSSTAFCKAGT